MGYKVKKIYQGSNLVRPKWQPGANTIAYRPLDTQNGLSEVTGHLTSVTSGCTVGNYQVGGVTVNCGYFNNTTMNHTSGLNITNKLTVSMWKYDGTTSGWKRYMMIAKTSDASHTLNQPRYCFAADDRTSKGMLMTLEQDYYSGYSNMEPYSGGQGGAWYHVVLTANENTLKLYSNGTLGANATKTGSIYPSFTAYRVDIGACGDRFVGYLSDVIIENRAWSQQDVTDYYNLTKSKYGL